MVSTSGRGPRIAALIRQRIEASLPPTLENAILRVGQLRSQLRVLAPGTGGELGQRRMKWMIEVCEGWSLEELSEMTEEMMKEVLKGWDPESEVGGVVRKYDEVGSAGRCPWVRTQSWWKRHQMERLGPWMGGFVMGAVASSLMTSMRWSKGGAI